VDIAVYAVVQCIVVVQYTVALSWWAAYYCILYTVLLYMYCHTRWCHDDLCCLCSSNTTV